MASAGGQELSVGVRVIHWPGGGLGGVESTKLKSYYYYYYFFFLLERRFGNFFRNSYKSVSARPMSLCSRKYQGIGCPGLRVLRWSQADGRSPSRVIVRLAG